MHSVDTTVSPEVGHIQQVNILTNIARSPHVKPDNFFTSSSFFATHLDTADHRLTNFTEIQKFIQQWPNAYVQSDDTSIAAEYILTAKDPNGIAAALAIGGYQAAANRIRRLHEMTTDADTDDPAIVLDSLRELALFFLGQRWIVKIMPEIALSPDGLLLVEWASAEQGVLAMKFLPDGIIQFAGVSADRGAGPRLRVHGKLPKDRALEAVRIFIPSAKGPNTPRAAA